MSNKCMSILYLGHAFSEPQTVLVHLSKGKKVNENTEQNN